MRTHKTYEGQRAVYTYLTADGVKITLRPGHDGVTEEDIRLLHRMDDQEVYNNCKNMHAFETPSQKEERKRWESEHPDKNVSVWNISLDYALLEGDSIQDILVAPSQSNAVEEENAEIERLHEIIEQLPDDMQHIYCRSVIEGYTNSEIALELGVTEGTIRYRLKKIKSFIKEKWEE